MEAERQLNLDAPFLSVRRIVSESEKKEKKNKNNGKPKRVIDSCPDTEHQTPICPPEQSFDHLTEPASVPFVWEQTPGMPKNMTELIKNTNEEETEYDEDNEIVSSNGYFSVNCSSNGGNESNKTKTLNEISEYRNLMMSRFLPAAKAMALRQKKEQYDDHYQIASPAQKKRQMILNREGIVPERKPLMKKKHESIIIQSHYEEDEESDDDDDDHHHHSIYSKKGLGFMPSLCKNSLNVLNPVPLRIKTCNNLCKSDKIIEPKPISRSNGVLNDSEDLQYHPMMMKSWSSRRLSGFISPYRYVSSLSDSGFLGTQEKADIFRAKGVNSKSQELYPMNTRENLQKSAEIRMRMDQRHESPLTRCRSIQETRFLVEEVKKRRSRNLMDTYDMYVSPPPLPKTPSESWLVRTLPYMNPKKVMQETPESTKWETIVKTSYIHHDHVRYSQELIMHPSRLHKT